MKGNRDNPAKLRDIPFAPATAVRIPLGTPKYDTETTGKLGSTNLLVFVQGRIWGPWRAPTMIKELMLLSRHEVIE